MLRPRMGVDCRFQVWFLLPPGCADCSTSTQLNGLSQSLGCLCEQDSLFCQKERLLLILFLHWLVREFY